MHKHYLNSEFQEIPEDCIFQKERALEIPVSALAPFYLKPSSTDKQLISVMKLLPYLGCGDYLAEKGLMLTRMSLDAFQQAAEDEKAVESVSASWEEELKFFGG